MLISFPTADTDICVFILPLVKCNPVVNFNCGSVIVFSKFSYVGITDVYLSLKRLPNCSVSLNMSMLLLYHSKLLKRLHKCSDFDVSSK